VYDICALGELLIDFTPSGKTEDEILLFGRNPGGAPANVLAMFSKLGGNTVFIGKVGNDDFGLFLEKTLKDAGINTSGLIKDSAYLTTLAFVQLSESGDRSFSFYRREGADLMLYFKEIDKTLIDDSHFFHFGSVSLSALPCRDTVFDAVNYARSKDKVISYDPNYRSFLWHDEKSAKAEIARFIDRVDILKVSEEEMFFLTGTGDIERGAYMLAENGPAIVLVSLGNKGAFFLCANGSGFLSAYNVKTIDTTGAGDAFLGATLFSLRNKSREDLQKISCEDLSDIVDFANAAGSLATTKKGAIPALPSQTEIECCQKTLHRLL